MPDYNISRLGDGVADGVFECDLVTLSGDYIATVARNHNGYLEEAMWRLEASGSLTLMNSIASDSVAGVAATTPDNELIVATAYTTHNDQLHTYSWVGIDFQGEATGIKTFHNPSSTSFSRNIPFPQSVTPPPPGGGPVSSVGARGYLVVTACSRIECRVDLVSGGADFREKFGAGGPALIGKSGPGCGSRDPGVAG